MGAHGPVGPDTDVGRVQARLVTDPGLLRDVAVPCSHTSPGRGRIGILRVGGAHLLPGVSAGSSCSSARCRWSELVACTECGCSHGSVVSQAPSLVEVLGCTAWWVSPAWDLGPGWREYNAWCGDIPLARVRFVACTECGCSHGSVMSQAPLEKASSP